MAPASDSQVPSTASTSSVRRNLFSNHLSHRRPDPTISKHPSELARNPSANSSTQSLSNQTNSSTSRRPTPRTQSNESLNNPTTDRHSRNNTDPNPQTNVNATNNSINGDIITRDRAGRPDLPEIPFLPPHLRLSSSEQPDANTAGEEGMDMDDVEGLELESTVREKEDQERIEKSLVDMMYRSRMRGNGHHGHGVGGGGGGGGGGSGLGAENEELLALVQASLRKKAASLEEDRWMFEGEGKDECCYGFR